MYCETCGAPTDGNLELCWRCIRDTELAPLVVALRVRRAASLAADVRQYLRARVREYLRNA